MKRVVLPFVLGVLFCLPVNGGEFGLSMAIPGIAPPEISLQVAASLSCSPRKTCKKIRSCNDAYWYLYNCSWGGRLDGDNDGVPCESLCR